MLGTHPLVRFLNQNRREIRIVIIVVFTFFIILRFLNSLAAKELEKEEKTKQDTEIQISMKNEYYEFVEDFVNLCMNDDESNAYAVLSSECKNKYFKTINDFKQNYIKKYFSKDKVYSVNYSSNYENNYVYELKIFNDMLSTGKIDLNPVSQKIIVSNIEGEKKIIEIH